MTTELFEVLIRILVAGLSVQQFRWQSNSSRIRWPRNSYGILQGVLSEFWLSAIVSNNSDVYEILLKIRWPQNSCQILPGLD